MGKGQCAKCKCWVPGNVAGWRHGLRRYHETGLLPDDLRQWRQERFDELVAALGGEDRLSPQRRMMAAHVINLEVTGRMQLDYAIRTGAETKRGRAALADYRASVDTLRRALSDLGFDAVAQEVTLADAINHRQQAGGAS